MHKVFHVHSFHFRDGYQNVLLRQHVCSLYIKIRRKTSTKHKDKHAVRNRYTRIESAWRPLHVTLVYVFYQYIPHLVCNVLLSQFNLTPYVCFTYHIPFQSFFSMCLFCLMSLFHISIVTSRHLWKVDFVVQKLQKVFVFRIVECIITIINTT